MRVLGVDPGQAGGLAIIEAGRLLTGIRMPTYEHRGKQIVNARLVINWIEANGGFDAAVVEAVHSMPGQGVSSSFQFGRSFGAIEATILSFGKPTHYVSPAVWKRALGLNKVKQQSIDAAKIRFGAEADALLRFKADDGIAEAALIAAYWCDKVPTE